MPPGGAARDAPKHRGEDNGQDVREVPKVAKKAAAKRVTTKPVLLSGGNPQIAKADGDDFSDVLAIVFTPLFRAAAR